MTSKQRVTLTISKETLEILKTHFPSERQLSEGVEACIKFYSNNTLVISSVNFKLKKLLEKLG